MVPCGLVPVLDDVGELDPEVPTRCGALEGDLTGLQELDEGGAADAEEVRGLLGGRQLVDGCDGDRSALRHGADDVDERAVRLHRETDGLTVRPDECGRPRRLPQEAGQVEHGSRSSGTGLLSARWRACGGCGWIGLDSLNEVHYTQKFCMIWMGG